MGDRRLELLIASAVLPHNTKRELGFSAAVQRNHSSKEALKWAGERLRQIDADRSNLLGSELDTAEASSQDSTGHRSIIISYVVVNFIVAPICILLICFAFGAVIALAEEWTVVEGFYFVACSVSGTGPFFEPPNGHQMSLLGECMEIFISIISLTCAALIIGATSKMSLALYLPIKLGVVESTTRFAGVVFLGIPVVILMFTTIYGSLFSVLENWTFREGFEYIMQHTCRLAVPLTSRQPETHTGKLIAIILSVAALGFVSVIVTLIKSTCACEYAVNLAEDNISIAQARICMTCSLPGKCGKIRTRPSTPSISDERG